MEGRSTLLPPRGTTRPRLEHAYRCEHGGVHARLLVPALVLVLAACGGGEESEGARAVIAAGEEEVVVEVEIADSDEERRVGLMNRESLSEDAGMIFLFPRDTRGGFW